MFTVRARRTIAMARQYAILTGQNPNLPSAYLQNSCRIIPQSSQWILGQFELSAAREAFV